MSQRYFHLTLGPVQSFVAQARRTRDFWAGSFLLSWMAGVAMAAVKHQGGQIEFPLPDESFLNALHGKGEGPGPQQGSIPNRFKALGARVDKDFDAHRVVAQLRAAWSALAEHVWQADLEPSLTQAQHAQSRAIWDRQVNHFWEISWCLSEDASASHLLDRRKNWRQTWLPEEPGVKCMMMEGWQELSGQRTPHAKGLEKFWNHVRERLGRGADMDLREGEVLSALGFIKRRFVRHFPRFRIELDAPEGPLRLKGWKLPLQVPSVAYLAAAPWFADVLHAAARHPGVHADLNHFLERAETLASLPELKTRLPGLLSACRAAGFNDEVLGIDGSAFFESQLENRNRFEDQTQASTVLAALRRLRKSADLGEPSPFYAILLMDGDSLGSQMGHAPNQRPISEALNRFTGQVPAIVTAHDGFLVYAGGDDVLAVLPVPSALRCAYALRNLYAACFAQVNQHNGTQIRTSISAAVSFCHIKRPLTHVLMDAHDLLDRIAKDKAGRDALAVRVWQPGGLHLQWAQPWAHAVRQGELVLDTLAQRFAEREVESAFTNKFLFKVMALAQRLPLGVGENDRHLLQQLIRAELLHSGFELGNRKARAEEADALLPPLLEQAIPCVRHVDEGREHFEEGGALEPDALLLVRFLARKGRIE